MYTSYDAGLDATGVHWIWWVLWLLIAAPVLLIVALVHHNKLQRAITYYRANQKPWRAVQDAHNYDPFKETSKYDGL